MKENFWTELNIIIEMHKKLMIPHALEGSCGLPVESRREWTFQALNA